MHRVLWIQVSVDGCSIRKNDEKCIRIRIRIRPQIFLYPYPYPFFRFFVSVSVSVFQIFCIRIRIRFSNFLYSYPLSVSFSRLKILKIPPKITKFSWGALPPRPPKYKKRLVPAASCYIDVFLTVIMKYTGMYGGSTKPLRKFLVGRRHLDENDTCKGFI